MAPATVERVELIGSYPATCLVVEVRHDDRPDCLFRWYTRVWHAETVQGAEPDIEFASVHLMEDLHSSRFHRQRMAAPPNSVQNFGIEPTPDWLAEHVSQANTD